MTNQQQQEPTNILQLYETLHALCKADILPEFTVVSYMPNTLSLYYKRKLLSLHTSAFDCIETARKHTKTFREVFA